MIKELSFGEMIKESEISVSELLAKIKCNDLKYRIENGHYRFPIEQILLPSKRKILKLKDLLRSEISTNPDKDEWEDFRQSSSFIFQESYIPSAKEIIRAFGKWEDFLEKAKKSEFEQKYEKIKSVFLESDEKYTPRLSRKSPVHQLVVRDVAKAAGVSEKKVEAFLKENGFLDGEFINKSLNSLEKIASTPICDKLYNGAGKSTGRDIIYISASELENQKNLSYLGLPSANFLCYLTFHKYFNIDPTKSLVVERNRKEANVMHSIIRHHNLIERGEIFKGLKLYEGPVEEALRSNSTKGMKFQLIFLDYEGGFAPKKEEAIKNLFVYGHLENMSLFYITLNNSPIELSRIKGGRGLSNGYGTTDQNKIINDCIQKYVKGFNVLQTLDPTLTRYKDTVEMITLGFKFTKK